MKRCSKLQQQPHEAEKRRRIEIRQCESMGSFDALDRHLLLDILSRLSPADIILRAGRVCKQWSCLTRSKDLRRLLHMRSAGNPWLGASEPWMMLRAGGTPLFYDSLQALLDGRCRWLRKRSFIIGPPGHKFRLVACHLGLVCGRLVDLDEGSNQEMTLAVGNPLTNEWRILPQLATKAKPLISYKILVRQCGNYSVRIAYWNVAMEYRSESRAWTAVSLKLYPDEDVYFHGVTVPHNNHKFVVRVERSKLSIFSFTGTQVYHWSDGPTSPKILLLEDVTDVAMAFLPALVAP